MAVLQIPGVLDAAALDGIRQSLASAEWIDGRATAGDLSQRVKHNRQLPETHSLAVQLGNLVLDALERHPLFMSAALPARIVPPLFNAYAGGQHYGRHIDGAVRPVAGLPIRVRTDLSATLFLTEPADYEGGELVIEDAFGGSARYKLAAGTLLLYPGNSVHRVEPVTQGERLAAFFWIQSMVREQQRRELLFSLDQTIQQLRWRHPDDPAITDLMVHYHNLLREWTDV